METIAENYSTLLSKLQGLMESRKSLCERISDDIEQIKTKIVNALDAKKAELLADVSASGNLKAINFCMDKLSTEYAKVSSMSNVPSDATQALERRVLEVKTMMDGGDANELTYQKAVQDIETAIEALVLVQERENDDTDNSDHATTSANHHLWLLPAESNGSGYSPDTYVQRDLSRWLTVKTVEKDRSEVTANWLKYASTKNWLSTVPTQTKPPSHPPSKSASGPKSQPGQKYVSTASEGFLAVCADWKDFANAVQWCRSQDAAVKAGNCPVKRAPAAGKQQPEANPDVFAGWKAAASCCSWVAAKTVDAPRAGTNVVNRAQRKSLTDKGRPSTDPFSGWAKAASEVQWTPLVSHSSCISLRQDRPSSDRPCESEQRLMASSRAKKHDDVAHPPPSLGFDDATKWLHRSSDSSRSLTALTPANNHLKEWLTSMPGLATASLSSDNTVCDDSQDFEIVEELCSD